jgi:hypothetical protein
MELNAIADARKGHGGAGFFVRSSEGMKGVGYK